jgi:hypothetical protein
MSSPRVSFSFFSSGLGSRKLSAEITIVFLSFFTIGFFIRFKLSLFENLEETKKLKIFKKI